MRTGHSHPAGHTVAGSFYLIWGLSWMLLSFWLYLTQGPSGNGRSKRKRQSVSHHTPPVETIGLLTYFTHRNGDPLANRSWIPLPFCSKIPIEPIIKIVLPGLGVIGELFFAIEANRDPGGRTRFRLFFYKIKMHEVADDDWAFYDLTRMDHVTLYFGFVVSGVMDLVSYYLKLPKKTSQLFLCFAFLTQWFVFSSHVHRRGDFNSTIHHNLLYFVMSAGIFSILRMLNPRNLLINAGLSASMILQGTNLIQAGWILYGPTHFSPDDEDNSKFISTVTIWHLLGTSAFMLTVFVFMKFILIRCKKIEPLRLPTVMDAASPEEESLIDHSDKETTIDDMNVMAQSSV